MNVRPLPPRGPYDREHESDYSGLPPDLPEGWWLGPALLFGFSGFLVGVAVTLVVWWLS